MTTRKSSARPADARRSRDVSTGFRILEHPSDLGIEAYGSTLAKAFEGSARGLVSIFTDPSSVVTREERRISLSATDADQMLVRWLEEILYLYDGEGFVVKRPSITSLSDTSLEAVVQGEPFDPVRHRPGLDVKAVTYHQLRIGKKGRRFLVRVFVDI